jgi:hydrogenase/urease accessory protein HupE
MRAAVALLLLLFAQAARAHELGRFQVQAEFLADGTYRVDLVADEEHLTPQLLRGLADGAAVAFDGRRVQPEVEPVPPGPDTPPGRMTIRLHGPIPGGARSFTWSDLAAAQLGSYPLIPKNAGDESTLWQWLEGDATSQPFTLAASVVPPTRVEIVGQYLRLGFTHILPGGLDHILFVLGLFLLSRKARPLLMQVTSFTIAHTVTLALSIYGLISLPSSVVEPLIALSIVFVAVENVLTSELRPSRVALVFAFGLLHGLGFAGVLTELGLPRSEFLPALISFNLGVESGQLAVIGLAFLAVGLFRGRTWYRQAVVVPASCLIAAVGIYWSIQRVFF